MWIYKVHNVSSRLNLSPFSTFLLHGMAAGTQPIPNAGVHEVVWSLLHAVWLSGWYTHIGINTVSCTWGSSLRFLADVVFAHTTRPWYKIRLFSQSTSCTWLQWQLECHRLLQRKRLDVTIIGWIHEAIVGVMVVPTIAASCVHRIVHGTTDGRAERIKERCVDNALGLDGHLWCAWQPEVQRIMDVLGSDCGRGRCAGGTSVKSRKTDRKNAYENLSPVFS